MRYRYFLPAFVMMFTWQHAYAQPNLQTILTINGINGQGLGSSILYLGDVNGDSLPDFGISARGFRKFYVYFGGKGVLDDVPDAEFKGGINAIAGDFNGDGLLDLVTTSHQNSYDTARVFLGTQKAGLIIDATPSFIIVSDRLQGGQDFGRFMAVGDLNKDGYDDLVIASPSQSNPPKRVLGKVYVFMGKEQFNGVPDFTGIGSDSAASSIYGWEAQIQDVNGDGYPDLIVGSTYNNNATGEWWSRIHIYRGSSNFTFDATKPDQLIESRKLSIGEKWYLNDARILDFNNDGREDIFVTHSDYLRIRSFVFLSTEDSVENTPRILVEKPTGAAGFFADRTVHDPGDINGDGHRDFAFRCHPGGPLSFLIYDQGSIRGLIQHSIARSQRPGGADYYGYDGAIPVGDQNGDGIQDVLACEFGGFGFAHLLAGSRELPVGVETLDEAGRSFANSEVYPNPFHSQTHIRVSRKYDANVKVQISDMLGRNIRTLHNGPLQNDNTVLTWDAKSTDGHFVSAGIYLLIISDGMELTTKPLVLLR